MIRAGGDSAMAILDRRFAKTPKPKRPEESCAISAGHEDSRSDDSPRCSRRAHENNLQGRLKFAAIRRAESASPRRAPQGRAPAQRPRRPALPEAETNARRFRQKVRERVRL